MSAARVMTLGSEVIMQPKPTVVTLSPVLPRVRWSSLGDLCFGRGLIGESRKLILEAAPATGSINPADRKSRRELLMDMNTPLPGEDDRLTGNECG